ncbi:MAG TPA: DNA glycosylase [Dysgonomonas sp.]|nr:DNA glycosylase [Dysgonomonas sp.]
MSTIEHHPLPPFLPEEARLLMLGSFPPKKERWSMDFYYPNFQNDMWRIFGLIFFDDKNYFISGDNKSFDKEKLENFLIEKHIAISDMAISVIRHKDNASDNFLEIVEPRNIKEILAKIPMCNTVVTTGQKATDIFTKIMDIEPPKIGDFTAFIFNDKPVRFYRMPSSSRAYPLKLEKKARIYKEMLKQIAMMK